MTFCDELGRQLAAYVFESGSEPGNEATRISFKSGSDGQEIDESALANVLSEGIRRAMHTEIYP